MLGSNRSPRGSLGTPVYLHSHPQTCTILPSFLLDVDSFDSSSGVLFYSGIELHFVQPKPPSYRCAKGRHTQCGLVLSFSPLASPVAIYIVLSIQLVHSFGLTEQSLCFIISSPSVCHGVNFLEIKRVSLGSDDQKTETAGHMG